MFRDMAERETARAEITAAFPDVLVTSSFRNNLELNAVDADKGRALLALARHLGIPAEDTVAFGDSSTTCGCCVPPAQALPWAMLRQRCALSVTT